MEEKKKHDPYEDEIIDLDVEFNIPEKNSEEKNDNSEKVAEIGGIEGIEGVEGKEREEFAPSHERRTQEEEFVNLDFESVESEGESKEAKNGSSVESLTPEVEEVTGVEDSEDEEFLVSIGEGGEVENAEGSPEIESDGAVPVFEHEQSEQSKQSQSEQFEQSEPEGKQTEESKADLVPFQTEEESADRTEEPEGEKSEDSGKDEKKRDGKDGKGKKIDLKNKKVVIGVVSVAGLLVGLGALGFILGGEEKAPTVSQPYVPSKRPAFALKHKPQAPSVPKTPKVQRTPKAPTPKAGRQAGVKNPSPIKVAEGEKFSEVNRLASSIIGQEKAAGEGKVTTKQVAVEKPKAQNVHNGGIGHGVGRSTVQNAGRSAGKGAGKVEQNQGSQIMTAAAGQQGGESSQGGLSVVVGMDKNIALLKKSLEYKKLLLQEKQTELKLKEIEAKEKQYAYQLEPPRESPEVEEIKSVLSQIRVEVENLKQQVNRKSTRSSDSNNTSRVQLYSQLAKYLPGVEAVSCTESRCRALIISTTGGAVTVEEGDTVGPFTVEEITPSGVLFRVGKFKTFVPVGTVPKQT